MWPYQHWTMMTTLCLLTTGCLSIPSHSPTPSGPALQPHQHPKAPQTFQPCPTSRLLYFAVNSDALSLNPYVSDSLLTAIHFGLKVGHNYQQILKKLPTSPPNVFFRRHKPAKVLWCSTTHKHVCTHTHHLVNALLSPTPPKTQKSAETKEHSNIFQ